MHTSLSWQLHTLPANNQSSAETTGPPDTCKRTIKGHRLVFSFVQLLDNYREVSQSLKVQKRSRPNHEDTLKGWASVTTSASDFPRERRRNLAAFVSCLLFPVNRTGPWPDCWNPILNVYKTQRNQPSDQAHVLRRHRMQHGHVDWECDDAWRRFRDSSSQLPHGPFHFGTAHREPSIRSANPQRRSNDRPY